MQITNEQKLAIDKLLSQITCNNNFSCVKSNFHNLCKVKYDHGRNNLLCLEKANFGCTFRHKVNNTYICGCPLRKIASEIVLDN